MTALVQTNLVSRYGSAAEVATFLGVSTKTVRRLVGSGALSSYRVGRRVLVPYRAADQLVRRNPIMAIAPLPSSEIIDPSTGRARKLSVEERKARSAALKAALAEADQITDETDTDEIWSEVFRGIDESRPHRPLFEGQY
jgi:excisionase family DNA binding protein